MAKTAAKPTKGSTPKKAPKGGHYTPPNASKELPPSFHRPVGKKGKEIPDD